MTATLLIASLKCLLLVGLVTRIFCKPMSTGIKAADLLHRHRRTATSGSQELSCFEMTNQEGNYWHMSTGSDAVCGLYLIGDVDTKVQLEVTGFDIGCGNDGLLALVDGWELQSQLFPSPEDRGDSGQPQYQTFCGSSRPPSLFLASQNVALILFRVPVAGQGFRVRVRFQHNPKPCNVFAPFNTTAITVKNFGLRRNCTAHILFPVNVRLITANVKTTAKSRRYLAGLSTDCGGDVVSFMYGNGLDTASLYTRMAFCGMRATPASRVVTLGCSNSALRLQSSGQYWNSVSVDLSSPAYEELEDFLDTHPHCLAA